ncbi:MAG TPA: addiction module protein [Gemmataceae bacterium]|nr:addiction module protein [Gemmataceae bacterium]
MTGQTQAVLDAALALPEAQRLILVERLMETLPPDQDDLTDVEFAAELDRRWVEFQQDPSTAVPWDQVKLGQ